MDVNIIELRLREIFTINTKVSPEEKKLEYISNNSDVIKVFKDGTIIKNVGEVTVIIKCEDVISIINVMVKSRYIIQNNENTQE